MDSRMDYDAPGHWCTTMLYSADRSRLFSCGTSKGEESSLVEWNESERAIKRTYNGFKKKSTGVVQFDTTKYLFLVAVTTVDNGFKILANATGLRSLRTIETPAFETLRSPIEFAAIKVSGSSTVNVNPVNCKVERSSPVRPPPILNGVDPMSRIALRDNTDSFNKVVRLLYTNSAVGVLALGSNGVQKFWKWARNEQNPTGKATASVVPQRW
ncbi:hypothetical protein KIW84_070906 [Lathyrus oleraceus]|uniref:Uncharacterized protein n=1 Tax=Pisum sativum TaxID=3888 RepID=A0A9D4ZV81_PEA|nr:hypothetical protein KIW84_070906 [Pisum sativum]